MDQPPRPADHDATPPLGLGRVTPPRRPTWTAVAAVAATLIVLAAVVVAVVVGGGRDREPPPPAPDGLGSDAQITVEGDQVLRNGEPWWFLGYNSFVWSGNCGEPDERMDAEQVDAWFASMRHDGHGAARLFFFEGWDIDRLDRAVEAARENDIYLMITLDDAIAGCGENEKTDEWFQDEEETAAYEEHMRMLLERYQGENTIAWFEFFNEPGFSSGLLREFYDRMGDVAESVDPDRLFSSGTVAPYSLGDDGNFQTVHESSGVDIASLHEYDGGEVESNHGPPSREQSAGKPVIVGEFGVYASPDGSGTAPAAAGGECQWSYDSRAGRIEEKAEVYTTVQGYAGAIAWAWQPGGDPAECATGNLDADPEAQDVLRTFVPSSQG